MINYYCYYYIFPINCFFFSFFEKITNISEIIAKYIMTVFLLNKLIYTHVKITNIVLLFTLHPFLYVPTM